MKINSISVYGFRGITSMNYTPKALNYFSGKTGTGKSSSLEAVRYVLTGKTRGDAVKIGSAGMSVGANVERIGSIERSVDASGKSKVRVNGRVSTAKKLTELFDSMLGISADSFNLLTSSEVTSHSLGKDLADYLLNGGFLSSFLTFSRLLALNPLPTEAADELREVLPKDPETITLENIEEAYNDFAARRAPLKKFIAEESARSKFEGAPPTRDVSAITSAISDLQVKIAEQRRLAADYPKKKAELEAHKRNIEEIRAILKKLGAVRIPTSAERDAANTAEKNARKLIDEVKESIINAELSIKSSRHALSALETDLCPLSAALHCTTDKRPLKAELEASIETQENALKSAKERLEKYQLELEEAMKTQLEITNRDNAAQQRVSYLKQLDALESIKTVIPAEPNPKLLAEYEAKLSVLNRELENARAYETAAEHKARMEAYSKKLAVAETLTKELAPAGGIRKQILEHSISPLTDWCNKCMERVLPKYKLRFDESDNFAVVVDTKSPDGTLSFESLSMGEQLKITTIIMAMLNEINGARICLIDNVNVLDADAFKDLIDLICDLESSFDHVFIAGIDVPTFEDIVGAAPIESQCIRM